MVQNNWKLWRVATVDCLINTNSRKISLNQGRSKGQCPQLLFYSSRYLAVFYFFLSASKEKQQKRKKVPWFVSYWLRPVHNTKEARYVAIGYTRPAALYGGRCLALTLFIVFFRLGDRLKLLRENTRNEVHKTMEEFTARIKTLAEELKAKQSKERSRLLKKLKSTSLKGMKYSTARLSMEAVLTEVDC